MTPQRTRVIEQMVRNYHVLSKLDFSVIALNDIGQLTQYEKFDITLKRYLENIGLEGDELAYGLGVKAND